MKHFLLCLLIMNMTAQANIHAMGSMPPPEDNLGRTLPLKSNDYGAPSFGFVFSLASEQVDMIAILSLSPNLSQEDIHSLPEKLKINIYNRKLKSYISTWDTSREIPKSHLIPLHNKIEDQQVLKALLPNITHTLLVIASIDGTPLYNVDIAEFCRKFPTHFKNVSNSKKCHQITYNDVN